MHAVFSVSLVIMIEGAIRFISYQAAAPSEDMSQIEYRAITASIFEGLLDTRHYTIACRVELF